MNWQRLPAIEGRQQGCLHAGVAPSLYPPNDIIAVGMGSACVTKDGRPVYSEDSGQGYWTGADAEKAALLDPDHDWRIHLHGPLSGRVYQRWEPGTWALVYQDGGFA